MSISARINSLNHGILVSMPIYCLRRVYIKRFNGTESEQVRAYALIPKRGNDWESVVKKFYTALSAFKTEEESIGVDGYTFWLKGNGYKIVYQIEFWGKRAEKIGYIKDGKPAAAPLLRLNSYFAGIKFAKMSDEQRNAVYDRIDVYANEAPNLNVYDRFVYAIYDVEGKVRPVRERESSVFDPKNKINEIKLTDGINKIIAGDDLVAFFSACDEKLVYEFEGEWTNKSTGERVSGKVTVTLEVNKFIIFEKVR